MDESPTASPSPQSKTLNVIHRILSELGLTTLFYSKPSTKILILGRFIRLYAYGASTLILVAYLSSLGHADSLIGLFMTLTLVGDIVISFFLTLVADGLGRRRVLALGASLMAVSGVVFAITGNYWLLLAAAIVGVISPSGNEIGPFRAIEESTLAHLTPLEHRSDIFVWYSLIGTAGTALGLMTCGWVTHVLVESRNWSTVSAYRFVFVGYAVIGVLKLLLALLLSEDCEVEKPRHSAAGDRTDATETAPLLAGGENNGKKDTKKKPSLFSLVPGLSSESKKILTQLCILFAFDNFASGLAPLSWVTYFFRRKFHISDGQLGSLFFSTSIIAAASMLVAASIAKRIGNIKTMVFTHLPSAICLALIPIPDSAGWAMSFLVLRSCTQSMDVAPRSAFLAAVVLPTERTVVMGTVNVVKTSAQSLGPLITGILATRGRFWVAFVMAGCLKATYDLGMLAVFVRQKPREEAAVEERTDDARRNAGQETDGDVERTPLQAGPAQGQS